MKKLTENRTAIAVLAVVAAILVTAAGYGVGRAARSTDVETKDASAQQTTTTSSTIATTTSSTGAPTTTSTTAAPKPAYALTPRCETATSGDVTPVAADWATQWQTQPQPNDPLTVKICLDDGSPQVGQIVTMTVDVQDPDATIENSVGCQVNVHFGLDDEPGDLCNDAIVQYPAAPRPTPAEAPGVAHVVLKHVYESSGTASVGGYFYSGPGDVRKPDPYRNYVEKAFDIQVAR